MRQENGCRFYPDCFTCPFFDCIQGSGLKGHVMQLKLMAKGMQKSGMEDRTIALKLNKSIRTIQRYLK